MEAIYTYSMYQPRVGTEPSGLVGTAEGLIEFISQLQVSKPEVEAICRRNRPDSPGHPQVSTKARVHTISHFIDASTYKHSIDLIV